MKTFYYFLLSFLFFCACGFAATMNDNPPQQKASFPSSSNTSFPATSSKASFPTTSSDLKEKKWNEYYQQNSSNNGSNYNNNENNQQRQNTQQYNNNNQSYLQPAQFPKTTKRCPKCLGTKCADCNYQGYILE